MMRATRPIDTPQWQPDGRHGWVAGAVGHEHDHCALRRATRREPRACLAPSLRANAYILGSSGISGMTGGCGEPGSQVPKSLARAPIGCADRCMHIDCGACGRGAVPVPADRHPSSDLESAPAPARASARARFLRPGGAEPESDRRREYLPRYTRVADRFERGR